MMYGDERILQNGLKFTECYTNNYIILIILTLSNLIKSVSLLVQYVSIVLILYNCHDVVL